VRGTFSTGAAAPVGIDPLARSLSSSGRTGEKPTRQHPDLMHRDVERRAPPARPRTPTDEDRPASRGRLRQLRTAGPADGQLCDLRQSLSWPVVALNLVSPCFESPGTWLSPAASRGAVRRSRAQASDQSLGGLRGSFTMGAVGDASRPILGRRFRCAEDSTLRVARVDISGRRRRTLISPP
jgi:hypothetical protein